MLLPIRLFSPLLLTVIAAAVPAMAGYMGPSPILVSQPTDYNGAYTSQNDTNGLGNYATVYDNFTLTTDSNIDTVQWVGSYFNPSQQAPITAWTVSFWADAGHQPGALLQAFNVAGNDGETFLQNDNVGDPAYLYTQTVNFNAAADTEYWISVVPDLGFPPEWGWETGTGGDGVSIQDFFGVRTQLKTDVAFTIFGTANTNTPEPFSLGLMGAGLLALGLAKVRRNRA